MEYIQYVTQMGEVYIELYLILGPFLSFEFCERDRLMKIHVFTEDFFFYSTFVANDLRMINGRNNYLVDCVSLNEILIYLNF